MNYALLSPSEFNHFIHPKAEADANHFVSKIFYNASKVCSKKAVWLILLVIEPFWGKFPEFRTFFTFLTHTDILPHFYTLCRSLLYKFFLCKEHSVL